MLNIQRLKDRRKQLGLTLEEVGEVAGLSKSAVQKYEKGIIKTIQVSVVESFAYALRCNPAYLLDWVDDPATDEEARGAVVPTTEETAIINTYRRFTDEGHAKVFEYLDDLIASGKYNKTLEVVPDTVRVYRAAKSASNKEGGMVDMPRSRLEKIRNAEEDDDL